MLVCHCAAVSDRTVDAVIASGADTIDAVTDKCGAGSGCGRCRIRIDDMLRSTFSCANATYSAA